MKRTLIFLLLLCLGLSACADRTSGPGITPTEAARAWQAFTARSIAVEKGSSPYRISANLRYTTENETQRLSSFLWSNAAPSSPVRLDLMAGGGMVVAKIMEDEKSFTAYIPNDNIAWYHPRDDYALAAFGVPIPLTLCDLSLLLTGRAGQLFLPSNGSGFKEYTRTENGFAYHTTGVLLPGIVEISPEGTPLSWRDQGGEWLILFEPAKDSPMRPRRLKVTHSQGYEAIVVVNSIEYLKNPFAPAQLNLNLPKSAQRKPIGEAYATN